MRQDFCVLILSHGRANNVKTVKTLKDRGYTGTWYIVIDDEDDQEPAYRKRYGEHIVQFCKEDYIQKTDTMNPAPMRSIVVYARNAAWDIAEQLGFDHFIVLDDDYRSFEYRKASDDGKHLLVRNILSLDYIFSAMFDFLDTSGAVTVAMAQGGDFIGGVNSAAFKKGLLRKAMNSFFCRTDRRFWFMGTTNEDTNAYTKYGTEGKLFFTVSGVALLQ